MKLVLVEWNDTYEMEAGWHALEDAKKWKPYTCCSVGYLLVEHDNHIVICADSGVEDNTEVGRVQAIPRSCINKIVKLEKGLYV